jgi:hypothetical protein
LVSSPSSSFVGAHAAVDCGCVTHAFDAKLYAIDCSSVSEHRNLVSIEIEKRSNRADHTIRKLNSIAIKRWRIVVGAAAWGLQGFH